MAFLNAWFRPEESFRNDFCLKRMYLKMLLTMMNPYPTEWHYYIFDIIFLSSQILFSYLIVKHSIKLKLL